MSAPGAGGARSTPAAERTRWGRVLALGLAMLVVTSDMTIAAVALPGIGADLDVGPGATAWVLLAYTLPMAGLGIPAGRWGDTADPRPVFLAALGAIAVSTVLTALAPTMAVLIAARLLQGAAGALVIAVYMPIVTASVPPSRRGRAISLVIMVMTVGVMAGAPAGGLVADLAGWRAVFLVKLPVLLAAALAGWVLLDRTRVHGVPVPQRGLLAEALLLGGAVAALLLAVDRAGSAWWAAVPAAAVGPAVAALCWTLAGGGAGGFRTGVAVLLVAVAAGTAAVALPALRRTPAPSG